MKSIRISTLLTLLLFFLTCEDDTPPPAPPDWECTTTVRIYGFPYYPDGTITDQNTKVLIGKTESEKRAYELENTGSNTMYRWVTECKEF